MHSICPHCKSFTWEIHEESPQGSAFRVYFVRCLGCKAPVGVLPFYDLHSSIENLEKKVKGDISTLADTLGVIDANIRLLFRK